MTKDPKLDNLGCIEFAGGGHRKVYVLRSHCSQDSAHLERDLLHVMSEAAGGEIRGYEKFDGAEHWRTRTPCHSGEWAECDQLVADLVGEPVQGLGGVVAFPGKELKS